MPVQVVDRGQRRAVHRRQRLGRGDADEESRDQPGAARHADQLDLRQLRTGPEEGVLDDSPDQLEVVTGGDLRHDSAVAVVNPLRGDYVRADLALRRDDGRAGVVAARLQGQDHDASDAVPRARATSALAFRHMISASSPVSR